MVALKQRKKRASIFQLVDLIQKEEMERKYESETRRYVLSLIQTEKMIEQDEEMLWIESFEKRLGLSGRNQREKRSHSEIYSSTLNVVSNCPSRGEYMQTSLTKCAEVCGSYMQNGDCAYHCMRDSSKTKLVEFCAKPKPLFEYCPEYDPVDQTIQKDVATLCNSTSSRNYYNSSEIFFCDPNNCLQLPQSIVHSGATIRTTPMNETTQMNGGNSQEWLLPGFVVIAFIFAIIGYIVKYVKFVKRGYNM